MKVLIVSTYDQSGGAARAAFRLHGALNQYGLESRMRAMVKTGQHFTVCGPQRLREKFTSRVLFPHFVRRCEKLQHSKNENVRNLALSGAGIVDEINASDADVVNLHWVQNEMFSVKDFARIRKPLVWTLHDMWAFCGAEHYTDDGPGARWRTGYTSANRARGDRGLDLDRWVWGRKMALWKSHSHIVTPSSWLTDCVRESKLMSTWPVSTIPNPLDLSVFKPWPKEVARALFKLPADGPVVLFGAYGNDRTGRKGVDLLYKALRRLTEKKVPVHGVIFGQHAPITPPDLGMPISWTGPLADEISLALLYSAADVMVVPSRMDNLPQTATEAQSCGCPVVAFGVGGLPDIVEHEETGYLAKPFDVNDLAQGIAWVLADNERHARLSVNSRSRSHQVWETQSLVEQYKTAYQRAIQDFRLLRNA